MKKVNRRETIKQLSALHKGMEKRVSRFATPNPTIRNDAPLKIVNNADRHRRFGH